MAEEDDVNILIKQHAQRCGSGCNGNLHIDFPPTLSTASPETTTPPPTTVTPPQSTTPPPTTTPPTTTTPCNYSQFDSTHTMLLPPDSACNFHLNSVSEADKALILQKHNELRAQVARGEETRGDPGPQPSAANMREFVWNDELATVAQAWAEQCPSWHDSYDDRKICSRSYIVGQNIYYYWGFNASTFWEAGVNAWYKEVADMPNTYVPSFEGAPPSGKVIGHYTQVVWANTYEVGCGAIHYSTDISGTTYPESKIYVCNYGPAGNFLGSPVYIEGSAASQCDNGPSTNYNGLCL